MNAPDHDVRALPDWGFRRMPIWWGNIGFMLIEGLGFVMLFAAYGFLASQNADWPFVHVLPSPRWGTTLAVFLILTEIPNLWLMRRLHRCDLGAARIGMILMSLLGAVALVIRALEFGALNVHWTSNAFGSMVWALLILHTTHLLADIGETWVMTVMTFVRRMDGARFVDLTEDAEYWHFVVLTWLPVYAAIYWLPRWMAP
jgi:heme/copper-type cytochrome/quinol oxidase subunit 3